MEPMKEMCLHAWKLAVEPFRVIGPLYYVGNLNVGCYLLDSGDGLILIDTAFPQTVYQLFESIRKVGFDPRDIKIILLTHGHYDHCGGMKKVKEYTKAEVYAGKEDLFILQDRHDMLYCFDLEYEEFAIDHFYEENVPIQLGNISITPVHTPGHTPGTYSLFFELEEAGRSYRCGLQGGLGLNTLTDDYIKASGQPLQVRRDYLDSLQKIENYPIDVVIPSHPNQASLFEKQKQGTVDAFICPGEWKEMLEEKRVELLKIMEKSCL